MLAQKVFSPIVHTSVQTWMNVTKDYKSRFILTFSFEIANRKKFKICKNYDCSLKKVPKMHFKIFLKLVTSSSDSFTNPESTNFEEVL